MCNIQVVEINHLGDPTIMDNWLYRKVFLNYSFSLRILCIDQLKAQNLVVSSSFQEIGSKAKWLAPCPTKGHFKQVINTFGCGPLFRGRVPTHCHNIYKKCWCWSINCGNKKVISNSNTYVHNILLRIRGLMSIYNLW